MIEDNITYNVLFKIENPNLEDIDFKKCTLLSILAEDKITTVVYHPSWNKFVSLDITLVDKLSKINFIDYYKNTPLHSFRHVTFLYDTPDFLMLNTQHDNQAINTSALNVLHGEKPNHDVMVDNIFEYDLSNAYRIDSNIHYNIVKSYLYADYWHINSMCIKSILKNPTAYEEYRHIIRVIFQCNSMTLVHIHDLKIKFIQKYEVKGNEDVVFLIGNYLKLHKIPKEEFAIFISGYILSNTENIEYYKKFFPNTRLTDRPKSFDYNIKFNDYPEHYFSFFFEVFWILL